MTGTDRPTAHQKKAPVWVVFLWGLLIGVLGWYSFERTLTHGYVIDDVGIVESNPNAAATASLPALFQKHYWQGTFSTERGHRNFHYRPLAIASYVLTARSLGNGPAPQHLVNVALHIIVSWLMLWVVYAWLQDTLVAGLAGVVFVTHPLHTEVIAMIVGRAELLAALGALSALGLAVAALKLPPERPVWQHWLLAGGAALCLFAGWLAKESAVLFFSALAAHRMGRHARHRLAAAGGARQTGLANGHRMCRKHGLLLVSPPADSVRCANCTD